MNVLSRLCEAQESNIADPLLQLPSTGQQAACLGTFKQICVCVCLCVCVREYCRHSHYELSHVVSPLGEQYCASPADEAPQHVPCRALVHTEGVLLLKHRQAHQNHTHIQTLIVLKHTHTHTLAEPSSTLKGFPSSHTHTHTQIKSRCFCREQTLTPSRRLASCTASSLTAVMFCFLKSYW